MLLPLKPFLAGIALLILSFVATGCQTENSEVMTDTSAHKAQHVFGPSDQTVENTQFGNGQDF